VEYVVKDVEAIAQKLREINTKKAETGKKGLQRIRGSVDLTFDDEKTKASGTLKMVGCYALYKRGLFGKKVRYFDVSLRFDRTREGNYRLKVVDVMTYTLDKGTVRLIKESAPKELLDLVDEDLREAGAQRA